MTTAAMVIGVVPLLIADGAGPRAASTWRGDRRRYDHRNPVHSCSSRPRIYSYVARDRRHMHDHENESDVLAPDVVSKPANDAGGLREAAE